MLRKGYRIQNGQVKGSKRVTNFPKSSNRHVLFRGRGTSRQHPRLSDEVPVLLLETIFIFPEEPLEIVKEHPVKHRVFRMTLAVDPCYGREDDS
jgi:hypothetical protein